MNQEKITERQREFARLIAKGEKQGAAYRKAFNCMGQSEAAVRSNASRLAKNDNIRRLIEELREQADSEAVMSRHERMVRLSRQAEEAAREGDRSGLVRVIDTLNKMDGAYKPERVRMENTMSIADIMDVLQARGCRPEVHWAGERE